MASCIGSGVPGDQFEYGHSGVIPGTEQHVFRSTESGKNSCPRRRARCRVCESTRYTWLKSIDFRVKAQSTHRSHARKMVAKGFSASTEQAVGFMNGAGVTVEWVAEMFRAAINEPCPGLCGQWVGGKQVRHVVALHSDLQLDWRDPTQPLTRENCGPLCATCNMQKGPDTWAQFMTQQHAINMNMAVAIPTPPPLQLFTVGASPVPRQKRSTPKRAVVPPPQGSLFGGWN